MTDTAASAAERQAMDVDIVCVGFGPATGGFLTTLAAGLTNPDGTPAVESRAMPGMPPQVICYERADDIAFGVSGIVTGARGIRATFPNLNPSEIPMAAPVREERVVYLLDPVGASRRSAVLRLADGVIRLLKRFLPVDSDALRLPYIPPFLRKDGGLLLSMGQFTQWVGAHVMGTGLVQIWPGTPVARPLIEDGRVAGVRLLDQGTDRAGRPDAGFLPGMDVRASLTVVGDGPVGPVGRQLDEHFGLPAGHHRREWAVGMKMVVELPERCLLEPGTVVHTFGYPEPEIFGFLYVYPDRLASLGIFVPSWLDSPVRTAYRYLQHWMLHPYLWRHLRGARLRSWGAKTLQESGRRGEPHLAGHGYIRIGEGSGSTNVLTGSGVDEAWTTGVLAADGVLELLRAGQPFTQKNLERAYVARRRVRLGRGGGARRRTRAGRVPARRRVGPFGDGPGRCHGRAVGPHRSVTASRPADPALGRVLRRADPGGRDRPDSRGLREARRLGPRRTDGARRVARHTLRWAASGHASGRLAHGREGSGAGRVRGPRPVLVPEPVRDVREQGLHRNVLGAGHRPGRRRRPGL